MQHYLKTQNYRTPAQSAPLREDQVKNNAGGYTWKISPLKSMERFLILGTEGGSYYVNEQPLTKEMAEASIQAIKMEGAKAVDLIVSVSDEGRALKNDTALFLLAAAAGLGDLATRRAALNALPKVARTSTHLFHFLEYTKLFRGWGRALKTAVSNWYTDKSTEELAYQMVKYRQRDGWTHRDVLRKAHPIATDPERQSLYDWVCRGTISATTPQLVNAFEQAIKTSKPQEAVELLRAYPKLPWEALNTSVLSSDVTWKAILPNLPLTALIRNLGRMTGNGTIAPFSEEERIIVNKLTNSEYIKRSRVHPLALFVAKRTYENGRGFKGSLAWLPNSAIIAALEEAFYKAFENIEPTGKRFLLALDVSASMGWGNLSGVANLTPRDASGLMALTTLKSEEKCITMSFSHGISQLNLQKTDNLDSVSRKITGLPFGGTDCALPMLYAKEKRIPVDTFVIYTDSETWYGDIHPVQALNSYRAEMNIPSKLIVVAMQANNFSIADPTDSGMLDIVGFDTNTPKVISEFSKL